jgi:hypothetical protein
MATIRYLDVGEEMPDLGDDAPWLRIESTPDGKFFGSGASTKPDGSWVGYGSLEENDDSFELAIAAAKEWAEKHDVPVIWVETNL